MISSMIGDFQPFTLFKVVKRQDLIQEEIYCIKEPYKGFSSYKNEYYKKVYNFDTHFTYYALFKYYDDGPSGGPNPYHRPYFISQNTLPPLSTNLIACFEHADSTQSSFDIFNKDYQIIFYRSVTKEEYYEKLKEKYNRNVLNIILKRLVDENFQSNYL